MPNYPFWPVTWSTALPIFPPLTSADLLTISLCFYFLKLCIAVPCHIFKFWAFIGIMYQVIIFLSVFAFLFTHQLSPFSNLITLPFISMDQVPLVLVTSYLQNKFQNSMVSHILLEFYILVLIKLLRELISYNGYFIQVGNIIFWCFFSILGQPMCVLLYYHDVMNQKVVNGK